MPPRYGPVVGDLCGADKDAGHCGIDHDVCSESFRFLLFGDELTAVVAAAVWPYRGRTNNAMAIVFGVCDILSDGGSWCWV